MTDEFFAPQIWTRVSSSKIVVTRILPPGWSIRCNVAIVKNGDLFSIQQIASDFQSMMQIVTDLRNTEVNLIGGQAEFHELISETEFVKHDLTHESTVLALRLKYD